MLDLLDLLDLLVQVLEVVQNLVVVLGRLVVVLEIVLEVEEVLRVLRELREELIDRGYAGEGYHYEAAAVMECLRKGDTECPRMPLDETLAILEVMDGLRASWGLSYPGDEEREERSD